MCNIVLNVQVHIHLYVLNVTKVSYSSQSVMLEVLLPDNVYQLNHIVTEIVISIVIVVKKLLPLLVPLVTKDSYLYQIMTEL